MPPWLPPCGRRRGWCWLSSRVSWRESPLYPPPRPRPPRPLKFWRASDPGGGVSFLGVEGREAGLALPKILARASSYRRCFSSSSLCWRILISSGVGWGFFEGSFSSSSSWTVNCSRPVTGSFLAIIFGVGLRLSSFMAGLKPVANGTLLCAAT